MAKTIHKVLITSIFVCLSLLFIIAALSVGSKENLDETEITIEKTDFPLEIDVHNYVFNMGEKISFNATITNKCGKDVTVGSNGFMPCMFLHDINDTEAIHVETTMLRIETLKANDTMSRAFEYKFVDPGTLVFDVHYSLDIDGVIIEDKIEFTVEVNS